MNPWGLFLFAIAVVLIVASLRNDVDPWLTKLRGSSKSISSASGQAPAVTTATLLGSGVTGTGASLPAGLAGEVQAWVNAQVPYVWGGASRLGADCSGYVQQLFAGIGVNLGRTTYDQVQQGQGVPVGGNGGLGAAQPGDVLFFDNNAHEGLYLGDGMMTDEPHTGGHAEIVPVAGYGTPDAIRRFLATGATVSAAPSLPGGVVA